MGTGGGSIKGVNTQKRLGVRGGGGSVLCPDCTGDYKNLYIC